LFYLMMVIWTEIIVAVFPNMKCRFIERFQDCDDDDDEADDNEFFNDEEGDDRDRARSRVGTRTGKKKKGKSKNKGLGDKEIAIEMAHMEFESNPMFGQAHSLADEHGLTPQQLNKIVKEHPEYQHALNLTRDQAGEIRKLKGKMTSDDMLGKDTFDNGVVKQKKQFGRVSMAPGPPPGTKPAPRPSAIPPPIKKGSPGKAGSSGGTRSKGLGGLKTIQDATVLDFREEEEEKPATLDLRGGLATKDYGAVVKKGKGGGATVLGGGGRVGKVPSLNQAGRGGNAPTKKNNTGGA